MATRRKRYKPLFECRVYPEGTWHYVRVLVWPSWDALKAHGTETDDDVEAFCRPMIKWKVGANKKLRRTGLLAEVNFYKERLGMETVTHEFTHAMFEWADRRGLDLAKISPDKGGWNAGGVLDIASTEERCCYALGRMARQFVEKAQKAGLYG